MAKNQLKNDKMVLNIGNLRNFFCQFKKHSASNYQKIKKLSASTFFICFETAKLILKRSLGHKNEFKAI